MNIKLVVFDFDGVFTDGKIIFDNNGYPLKHYNAKDGMGIFELHKNGFEVGVISGWPHNNSQNSVLTHLQIKRISLGSNKKLEILQTWCNELNINLDNVAYMGDDINDLQVMNEVKLVGCPNDAVEDVKSIADFISSKNGGEGAVRTFCDYIILNRDTIKISILNEINNEFKYQINKFNLQDIHNIGEIIKKTKGNIYFCGVGKSGNIAKHCCDLLKCISFSSFYFDIMNSTHGDIGTMSNEDIVLMFSNSGNTIEIVNIIPLFKNIGIKTIGICCNKNSEFLKLCDLTINIPFRNEITGKIDKIPTNSIMSQMLFCNILVSILKDTISIDKYKENHLSGNIGKNLLKIKDVLITEYPKIIIDDNLIINMNIILLEMTKYQIGCCFFVNKDDNLIGILTDGDIRRLLLKDENSISRGVTINSINKNYKYESDSEKYIKDILYKCYLPIIQKNILIGVISN